jgi:hypothetical protein
MKRAYVYVCLLTFGLVGGTILSVVPAPAQIAITVSNPSATQPDNATKDAQTFLGRITQTEGKFVLVDTENKATFQLDDQEKAKPFDGKTVKVTGKLDPDKNIIHVLDIQVV